MDERDRSGARPSRGTALVAYANETDAKLLARAVERSGFRALTAANGKEAYRLLMERTWSAVIVDLEMHSPGGAAIYADARRALPGAAILAIVSSRDVSDAAAPLPSEIDDFLLKPQDFSFASARVRLALERREQRLHLERRAVESGQRLAVKFQHFLRVLLQVLEARDMTAYRRSARVANLAGALCEWLLPGDRDFRSLVRTAGMFHDIGIVGLREAILSKDGKLNAAEIEEMHQHPDIGETILRPLFEGSAITGIVRHHHEQWDGGGYPDGLTGEEIPLGARIVAVADAYEAMTAPRRYRPAMETEQALSVLRDGAGGQWDPQIVEALLDLADQQSLQRIAAGEVHEIARSVMSDVDSMTFAPGARHHFGTLRRPVVLVRGDMTPEKLARLRGRIEQILTGGEYQIVLDMATAGTLGDDSVEVLHLLHRQAQHHGGRLILRDPSPSAMSAFTDAQRETIIPFEFSAPSVEIAPEPPADHSDAITAAGIVIGA